MQIAYETVSGKVMSGWHILDELCAANKLPIALPLNANSLLGVEEAWWSQSASPTFLFSRPRMKTLQRLIKTVLDLNVIAPRRRYHGNVGQTLFVSWV